MGIFNFRFWSRDTAEKPHKLGPTAKVRIRGGFDREGSPWTPDIVLARGFASSSDAEAAINCCNWDEELSSCPHCGEICRCNAVHVPADRGIVRTLHADEAVLYPDLQEDDLRLTVRVESTSAVRQAFTVRVFIAPEALAHRHEAWMELGRATRQFAPGERRAIAPSAEPINPPPDVSNPPVPRSFDRYQLLLLVTDTRRDMQLVGCGCGGMDVCKSGADLPWSYPFDRPLGDSPPKVIARRRDMVSRVIEVVWK